MKVGNDMKSLTQKKVTLSDEYLHMSEERKKVLHIWINENLVPRKIINKSYSSYGLRDLIERDVKQYFSNDEFKGAMLELGYRVEDPTVTNWYFGISKRSIDTVWKRIFG
jgi:hypothetical protein